MTVNAFMFKGGNESDGATPYSGKKKKLPQKQDPVPLRGGGSTPPRWLAKRLGTFMFLFSQSWETVTLTAAGAGLCNSMRLFFFFVTYAQAAFGRLFYGRLSGPEQVVLLFCALTITALSQIRTQ